VLERCPELQALTGRVRGFAEILTNLRGEQLADRLDVVHASGLPRLNTFASGIDWNRAAVLAGLTPPWSSGTCEGAVNRLNMLMRQTFGRAGFPLLRRRILLGDAARTAVNVRPRY
jgi:transposase